MIQSAIPVKTGVQKFGTPDEFWVYSKPGAVVVDCKTGSVSFNCDFIPITLLKNAINYPDHLSNKKPTPKGVGFLV